MTDGERHDDEDRWLEARERGEPPPVIPDATAATYARLHALLEDLPAVPAGASMPVDWQQAVLDAIDRGDAEPAPAEMASQERGIAATGSIDTAGPIGTARPIETTRPKRISNKQRAAIAVSCLAVAAGIAIVLHGSLPGRTVEPVAALAISPIATGEPTLAGPEELRAGTKAVARGVIDGPGELRVYGADDIELARCTEAGPGCTVTRSGGRTELRLELLLPVPGPLHVLLLSAPLKGVSEGRARDLEAAERAGFRVEYLDKSVR